VKCGGSRGRADGDQKQKKRVTRRRKQKIFVERKRITDRIRKKADPNKLTELKPLHDKRQKSSNIFRKRVLE